MGCKDMGNFWYKQIMVHKKNSAINYNIVRYQFMKRNPYTPLFVITLFAIAMGYLESAVVVYLREIYYPEGFAFPLRMISGNIAQTELFREIATMIMLAGIGYLAGRNRMQRFGVFLYTFGIWDIFYYVFLKLLIGWPESLLTWDILFLIPVTWVGPVLAPSINALTMCILGGLIYFHEGDGRNIRFGKLGWTLLITGSVIVLASYTCDYMRYMVARMPLTDIFRPASSEKLMSAVTSYVPGQFNWWTFGIGQTILILAVAIIFNRRINPSGKGD
jgi:hypothetical protein